ncbi:DMT family transporter [Microbacterium sp. LRZ72]|uniref:DMT family transporter n=1 Tax=Microbacterium sp. LRZ72 TaxID=2942481 RepID=UPI0029B01919|nr:DMT family transporter [Microbacterium sp. LRZ72]MDX2375943.1 DMT family transporter [Microbacterium sp. LRZ72]
MSSDAAGSVAPRSLARDRRSPTWLAVAGAVCVGALTALQAHMNGALGRELADAFVAAAFSFGSGLVLVLAISAALPAGRRGLRRLGSGIRARDIPVWMLAGGIAGAVTVATQGLTVALLGVALFTVGLVAGQTIGGLVLDRLGHGPGGAVAVTMPRVGGAVLALAGVGVAVGGVPAGQVPWWMLVLPVIAGAGIAWQQGTNGRLRQRVDSALTATLVNFAGGTAVLVVAAAVHVALVGPPRMPPVQPWIWLGGATGVLYIFLSAALVRRTGVLLLGLGSVVGLLVTSVVLDLVDPAAAAPDAARTAVAAAIALGGAVLAAVPWQRRVRRQL